MGQKGAVAAVGIAGGTGFGGLMAPKHIFPLDNQLLAGKLQERTNIMAI
ncbi:hypothetical protein [Brevibacillus choshinensis]|uniref:Uncharacterized protein n=1 Tax=Brevibacillus choshinensis TaxID=54911 RepID=A0ABX7FM64_BRECH|nr:hypothetical protein [Brevibacillus choshinensis]QRG67232.1 hypothetical protein JNE38_27910 [Brevibacillus choshinensis]